MKVRESRGRAQPATVALEQLPPEHLLEALNLLAHGRLRQVKKPRRSGHPASLGGSNKRPEKGSVDIVRHGYSQ